MMIRVERYRVLLKNRILDTKNSNNMGLLPLMRWGYTPKILKILLQRFYNNGHL